MVLNTLIVIKGDYSTLTALHDTITKETNKSVSKLNMEDHALEGYLWFSLLYKGKDINEYLDHFLTEYIEMIYMIYNEPKNVWIVKNRQDIIPYQLIPPFAMNQILFDYMAYMESSIVLDTFETIKFDQHSKRVVLNDKKLSDEQIQSLLFNTTIKGKKIVNILEEFIYNFYDKCINTYDNLYSISKDEQTSPEPSPLSLFIITFGIFAIIALLMKVMGYF